MRISTKLSVFFCFFLLFFALGSGFYMTDLWQRKEDMFKKVNATIMRVELILDMRSNLRNMTLSSRNMVLISGKEDIRKEWQSILEQRELYMRNRKYLIASFNHNDNRLIDETISEILKKESVTLNALLTPGLLVLENNHNEAIKYLIGKGRKNQRDMFDLLTSLSDYEKQYGRSLISNYRKSTSESIMAISLLFFVTFAIAIGAIVRSVFLTEKLENIQKKQE